MAGLYKDQQGLDDCLLVNENDHVLESINANLFAVKNGVLYTSPISEGCLGGIMRSKVMEIAAANKIGVQEVTMMQNVLLSADELFLTNVISGIRWIVAYRQKRYFNNTSKLLVNKLNEYIQNLDEELT